MLSWKLKFLFLISSIFMKHSGTFLNGISGNFDIIVHPGRTYDYSDYYGGKIERSLGRVVHDLYRIDTTITVKPVTEGGYLKRSIILLPVPQMIEQRFDLKIAHLSQENVNENLTAMLNRQDVHVVAIDNPTADQIVGREGFIYTPNRVTYSLAVPKQEPTQNVEQALEKYYESNFKSDLRRKRKREVRLIEEAVQRGDLELVTDKGGDNLPASESFLELYDTEMGTMERGRRPLLAAVEKAGGKAKFMKPRTGIYLKQHGQIIGGIIVRKHENYYEISYEATDREKRQHIRNMSFYFLVQVLRLSIADGFTQLSCGTDTNLYGHHLNVGLMRNKVSVGYVPQPYKPAGDQLMRITHFEPFNFPIFFYNYATDGQLESTAIAPDTMADEVERLEGVTPKFNVYAYADGKITPTTIAEMKARKKAAEAAGGAGTTTQRPGDSAMGKATAERNLSAPGGIDLNAVQRTLNVNASENMSFSIDPAMLEQFRKSPGFTPVIINITPDVYLRSFLGLNNGDLSPRPNDIAVNRASNYFTHLPDAEIPENKEIFA